MLKFSFVPRFQKPGFFFFLEKKEWKVHFVNGRDYGRSPTTDEQVSPSMAGNDERHNNIDVERLSVRPNAQVQTSTSISPQQNAASTNTEIPPPPDYDAMLPEPPPPAYDAMLPKPPPYQ